MSGRKTKSFYFSLKLLFLGMTSLVLAGIGEQARCEQNSVKPIQERIDSRISEYVSAFPEIQIFLLRDGPDSPTSEELFYWLGNGARNLDYEHPDDLRMDLLRAQMFRIDQLRERNMPSSTFFRVGKFSEFTRPYVCVVTLDENWFQGDDMAATRFMLDLDEKQLARLPRHLYLDNDMFVMFSLDHEVFHCLDSFVNGPAYPQTFDDTRACFDAYRAEARADIYAALAHRQRITDNASFLDGLAFARTLGLREWNPTHFTAPELRKSAAVPRHQLTSLGIEPLTRFSMRLADEIILDHTSHKRFLVANFFLLKETGVLQEPPKEVIPVLKDIGPDNTLMEELRAKLAYSVELLAGSATR